MKSQERAIPINRGIRTVTVDVGELRCVNCEHFEQYWRENRRNPKEWQRTTVGFCTKREREQGALRDACIEFDKRE